MPPCTGCGISNHTFEILEIWKKVKKINLRNATKFRKLFSAMLLGILKNVLKASDQIYLLPFAEKKIAIFFSYQKGEKSVKNSIIWRPWTKKSGVRAF